MFYKNILEKKPHIVSNLLELKGFSLFKINHFQLLDFFFFIVFYPLLRKSLKFEMVEFVTQVCLLLRRLEDPAPVRQGQSQRSGFIAP